MKLRGSLDTGNRFCSPPTILEDGTVDDDDTLCVSTFGFQGHWVKVKVLVAKKTPQICASVGHSLVMLSRHVQPHNKRHSSSRKFGSVDDMFSASIMVNKAVYIVHVMAVR